MSRKTLALACVSTLLLASPALGQDGEELISDRPDFTESAETVSPRRAQLEAGWGYSRDDGESGQELGQALLRLGLMEDLELRLGLGSWVRAGGREGWDGGSIGVKVHLLDAWGPRPAFALLAGAATPLGDDEVAADAWQPEAKVALAWELGDGLGLGVNGGYARVGEGSERFDQGSWSASLGWGVSERWGVFVEAFGFTREEPGGEATTYVDGGLTWLLAENLQLDLSGGKGLEDEATDWFVGAGVVKRW